MDIQNLLERLPVSEPGPNSSQNGASTSDNAAGDRAATACASCRSRKVRCLTSFPGGRCQQCEKHDLQCLPSESKRGRKLGSKNTKPRGSGSLTRMPPTSYSPPIPSYNLPIASSSSDSTTVLADSNQLSQAPLSLLATASAMARDSHVSSSPYYRLAFDTGIFASRPDIDPQDDPVRAGLVNNDEAHKLFEFFGQKLAGSLGFYDHELHSFNFIQSRSAFLFTTLLYLASKHEHLGISPDSQAHSEALRDHLYSKLWPKILLQNLKSVEIAQACLMLGTYSSPPLAGEEETSWPFFGHSLRICTELGLNRDFSTCPTRSELDQRLVRNAERSFLTCIIADRSFAAQMGRPATLAEGRLGLSSAAWLKSPIATLEDLSTCALLELRRIQVAIDELAPSAYLKPSVAPLEFELWAQELERWRETWCKPDYAATFRVGLMGPVYYHYAKILFRCRKLRFASNRKLAQASIFSAAYECVLHAATEVKSEAFLYAHNSLFTMISYACSVLVTMREFHSLLVTPDTEHRSVVDLFGTLATKLEVAGTTPPHKRGMAAAHALTLRRLGTALQRDLANGSGGANEVGGTELPTFKADFDGAESAPTDFDFDAYLRDFIEGDWALNDLSTMLATPGEAGFV